MKNNYLLEYIDNFSYQQKIKEILKKEKIETVTFSNAISEYSLSETALNHILEDLDTYSLFNEKKVIIIKNVELMESDSKSTKHLLKYLETPDPNKILIMSSQKLDTRKKITKILKENSTYFKLEGNPKEIIENELKGYKIESDTINLLIEYENNKIDAIKKECDKLAQYKYQEKEITKEDIKNVCYKHLGDANQIIFDLVKYICSKNKKNSLINYQKLQKYNIDDNNIIALLESQLRLLKQVSILIDQNKRKQEIATFLDIHPYRIEKTMELLRNITKKEINSLICSLANVDYKIKSGREELTNPLELFLINL